MSPRGLNRAKQAVAPVILMKIVGEVMNVGSESVAPGLVKKEVAFSVKKFGEPPAFSPLSVISLET